MDQESQPSKFSKYKFKLKSQKQAVDESFKYMKDRMTGNYTMLKTFSSRLDEAVGCFDVNTILTISALSGGGKSTLAKRLLNSIIKNLKDEGKPAMALSFNFEMLAHKTVGRELSNMANMDLRTLYSVDHPLSHVQFDAIVDKYRPKLDDLPIMYVEEPEDYNTITDIIEAVWEEECKESGKILIVEIDHAMITKGSERDTAKDRVDKLMENLNILKKRISSKKGKLFIILLSQMNRDIKDTVRRTTPSLHYPMSSDLFQSSSIEFYSDYILISHMPATLQLSKYGQDNFPVYAEQSKVVNGKEQKFYIPFIYFHLVKNRDGQSGHIIPYLSNLRVFDFTQLSREDFLTLKTSFNQTNNIPNLSLINGKEN